MADLTDAALWWASRGVPVFPCRGKAPTTKNGLWDGTTEPDEVRGMFLGRTGLNIGLRTGDAFVAIDLDVPDGWDNWIDLQARHGDVPQTFTVATPSGGRHLYFKTWPGAQSSIGRLAPRVDVRGEGGYVVGPPSEGYKIIDPSPPADLPDAFKELVTRKPQPKPRDQVEVDQTLTEEDLDKGDRYMSSVLDKSIARLRRMAELATPDGEGYTGEPWDATVYAECCNLLELANSRWNRYDTETVLNAIVENAPRDARFTETQVYEKWFSAVKKIGDRGRPKPNFFTGKGIFDEDDEDADDPEADSKVDPATFFRRGEGLIADLLAQAVLDIGPLAVDDTPAYGIWRYDAGVWKYAPREVQDRVVTLLRGRFRPGHVKSVLPVILKALSDQGAIIRCDPTPDLINTRSGMLEWEAGRLREHRPEDYSTVQLPVEWDPDATCPKFDAFLADVMAPDAIDYIWEILGYLVMSGNPMQKAILFHGEGNNGKGTLIRVLHSLLGHSNTSSVTLRDITEGKFETASLYGKIANLAGDIDASYLKSTAKFKAITGEDVVDAQRKYQDGFQFRCWAVPVFSANRYWRSSDTTKGYQRRWVLVPFPRVLERPIPGLSNALAQETSGILVKAVEGLRRLMERGSFDVPYSAQEAHKAFDVASDQVREWIEDDAAIVHSDAKDVGVWTASSQVYAAYKSWAETNGLGALSMPEFKGRLTSMGFQFYKNGSMRVLGMRVDISRRHASAPTDGMFS